MMGISVFYCSVGQLAMKFRIYLVFTSIVESMKKIGLTIYGPQYVYVLRMRFSNNMACRIRWEQFGFNGPGRSESLS